MISSNIVMKSSLLISLLLATPAFAIQAGIEPLKHHVVASTPEDEAKVTNTIKRLISKSSMLANLKIDVSTSKGIVTLKGEVDSNSQAASLVEFAESVVGVSDVNTSELKVRGSTQPMTDTFTTAKIKGLFIREEMFGEKDLNTMETTVETKNGVVYLTGVVENKGQIDNAIEIIKQNVPEVKKVVYSIKKLTPANNVQQ